MLLGLAIEGAGILRLSEHVVAGAIQKGQLEPLLQDEAFLDFLMRRLGPAPWRIGSGAIMSAQLDAAQSGIKTEMR